MADRNRVGVTRAPNGSDWPTSAAYVPGYEVRNADGLSTVTVDNSRNSSAMFVKLIPAEGGLARAFYVPGNESFTLRRVTAGSYQIHYQDLSDGSYWGSQPFDVTEIREPDGKRFSKISITLFKVLNGNFDTHPLTASDF